jgi:hypothetical protein
MPEAANPAHAHAWRFFRAGGFDQVRLDRGADLAHLAELDQKLWTALSCPTTGVEFDARTLELLDVDQDGRIRVPELLSALQWTLALLKNPDDLVQASPSLPLAAINDQTPEGRQILASAQHTLETLGKTGATAITLEDTAKTARMFAQTRFNGDGLITTGSTDNPALQTLIQDILNCVGSEPDRSGQPGINQAHVDQFFADAAAHLDWLKRAESEAATLLPLGGATAAASAALASLRPKLEDYFARCRLAAFDPRAAAALNREEKEFLAMAAKELTINSSEISGFPLARIEPGRPLPLQDGVNPAWATALAKLKTAAVKPMLGEKNTLTEAEWRTLEERFAPHAAWLAAKAGPGVEKLGVPRLREILAGQARAALTALIHQDQALEPEFNAIAQVDKLARFYRWLHPLCVNFVSFKDFFALQGWAIFQVGTLYLDQRSCNLCLAVADPAQHAALAGLAGTYLAYCDCSRKGSNETRQIVAAFTNGDSDHLMVGRNGVFYDRQGRDWHATIIKVVENPLSIRQAFFSPYKKFLRMIEEMVAKRAAAADSKSTAQMESTATTVASGDKPPAPPPPRKLDIGTVAAIGIAVGALGTFFAAIWSGLLEFGPTAIITVILAVILLISGPSMIIAWLKLRKRSLGPILDANGWAVNARVRINTPFGASLTHLPKLPPGSQRDLKDPYAEKRSPWPKVVVFLILLWIAYAALNQLGYIHQWTSGRLGAEKPPAAAPAAPTPVAPVEAPAEAPVEAPAEP